MTTKAALFLNLGSPDSSNVSAVRRYLGEFLMDERVLDAPYLIRWLIVHGMILPMRPKVSAELYRRIWMNDGSPLVVTGQALRNEVQMQFDFPIELAMRYGNPSTPDVLRNLHSQGVKELLVFPLYPHYAMSSYETALVKVTDVIGELGLDIRISIVQPFYEEQGYIDAMVDSARSYLNDGFDQLLFSFHGIPERHLRKTDPSHSHCLKTANCCQTAHPAHATCYRHQCLRTAQRVADTLEIPTDRFQVSFQSRLGRAPWLAPYTDETLKSLGGQGYKRVLVICPAFVADCLETLEEIAMEGKQTFLNGGGEDFQMIPCLNTHPTWVQFVVAKVRAWAASS